MKAKTATTKSEPRKATPEEMLAELVRLNRHMVNMVASIRTAITVWFVLTLLILLFACLACIFTPGLASQTHFLP
jgi:hypothetical protein